MHTPFRASLLAAAVASLMGFATAATAQVTDAQGDTAQSGVGQCISTTTGKPTDCSPAQASPETSAPATKAPQAQTSTPSSGTSMAAFETPAAEGPAQNGYVVDVQGAAVQNGTGNCIQSGTGAVDQGVPECGGASFAQFATPPAPPAQPPAAEVQPPPMQRVTLDTDTTFAFDSATLTDQGKAKLDQIVDAAKNAENLRVHIAGYTDRIGTKEYNLGLSERRAEAVRNYLASKGVPSDAITLVGRGESDPIVQCEGVKGNALIQCLQPNRRSEVEFAALEPATDQGAADQGTTGHENTGPGTTDQGTPNP